ncbi:unnamed protein product [Clonostachys rosea]|uniref:Xylanolytic transcriptional activator regulatory domain-containing protein n=1 Tax=Bionectria ochroleuca TaxID=29856 RepID=A0ABY6UWQ0_BIOOC|nr:unnamed protein product [Clonostachys rosea]
MSSARDIEVVAYGAEKSADILRTKTCKLCEIAGVECVEYDSIAQRHVPRSYVQNLEDRVAYLETMLQRHGINYLSPGSNAETVPFSPTEALAEPSATWGGTPELNWSTSGQENQINLSQIDQPGPVAAAACSRCAAVAAAKNTRDTLESLIQSEPHHEPGFSKLLLSNLMKLKSGRRMATSRQGEVENAVVKEPSPDLMSGLDTSQASLPTRDAARNITNAYFQWARLGMPLLHEPTFLLKLELLYSMPAEVDFRSSHTSHESRMAVFLVYEVFAVALMVMQKQDPSKAPTFMADRYHRTALSALDEAGLPTDVEGVQALLLVAQYSYHHPTAWAVWKTIGAALRLAVELGLHQDAELSEDMDALKLDTMRRVFWVAYSMDRSVAVTLSLPSCLADGAISTKFPSLVNDEYITTTGVDTTENRPFWTKSISIHLFRYRRLQSEIRTMLYEKLPSVHLTTNLQEWQKDMDRRLHNWFDEVPHSETLNRYEKTDVENFELSMQRALLLLYQPSPNMPDPPGPILLVISKIASKLIQIYRRYFREYRLSIYWQAVESLSSAGTALIYSFVNSAQVRDSISLTQLESLFSTCSSVLWGMVEHFPAFKNKRDAFDILASKTLADLSGDRTQVVRDPSKEAYYPNTQSDRPNILRSNGSSTTFRLELNQQPVFGWAGQGAHYYPGNTTSSTLPVVSNHASHATASPQRGENEGAFVTQLSDVAFDGDESLFRLSDWQAVPDTNDVFGPAWI